ARPGIASWLLDPGLSSAEFFQRRRITDTFTAIEELATHLEGIGGRKNVIWVSEAFAVPVGVGRQEMLERMRRATRALSHAQAALYPVDARGLVGAISFASGKPSLTTFGTVRGNIESMEIVAEETGGRAFANTNALDRSIWSAVDDARFTYVLGYYPSSAFFDRGFRKIDVNVTRKKASVRHRAGYHASPPPAQDTPARDARFARP
ncbi:MAG: VWA domain-containing protein, partial [Acidobacteria bacterium]|nr:VWA domain-containing protein [Acidobacteriota bacterium]